MAKLDLGEENSWGFRSSALIQMQPSVAFFPSNFRKEDKDSSLQSQAGAPSEPILIMPDKETRKERSITRKNPTTTI